MVVVCRLFEPYGSGAKLNLQEKYRQMLSVKKSGYKNVFRGGSAVDKIILVDTLDREIGSGEKLAVHRRPLLHRAFSIFLYDDEQILLQKRAASKYHSPGLWGNSCCSHPRVGETLMQAAERRLQEELSCSACLEEIGSFVYFHRFARDLFEYEYDHVLVGRYQGAVKANPSEIDEIKWCKVGEIMDGLISQPEKYCPWFRTAAPMVFRWLKDKGAIG